MWIRIDLDSSYFIQTVKLRPDVYHNTIFLLSFYT
jgi:hypothetical protein